METNTMATLCPMASTTTECGREILKLCLRLMLMLNTLDTNGMETNTMATLCPMASTTTECGREMLNLRLMLMLNTTTPDTTTAILMDSTITNGTETNTMVKGGDTKTNGTTNGGSNCLARID